MSRYTRRVTATIRCSDGDIHITPEGETFTAKEPPSAPASQTEAAREWWNGLTGGQRDALSGTYDRLAAYAAHIQGQERERAAKMAESIGAHVLAAAIRKGE